MAKAIIRLENIKFTYAGASQPTLQIPELEILEGQRVFIYGPSGSGKTTLLELLSGVLVPQQGTVVIQGLNLAGLTEQQRDHFRAERLGYVFQSFNLLPYLSVIENILLPLKLRGDSVETIAKAQELLQHLTDALGLIDCLHESVSRLSVGQQQRVALARALVVRPQIILADEPTSSLDYDNRENFLKLLFAFCKESHITVLFVSHDRTLESLFDRTLSFADLNRQEPREGRP